MNSIRRVSYVFLCIVPFLSFGAAALHALRIPGVYHVIGGVLFATISTAAWALGARTIRADAQGGQQLGLAGTLLVTPFALVALLWVGLGGPWQATAAENQMRYLVLIIMASAAVSGFVVLREALSEAANASIRRSASPRSYSRAPCILSGMPLSSEPISRRNTPGRCLRPSPH